MLKLCHNCLAEFLALGLELDGVLVDEDVVGEGDGVAVGEEASEGLEEGGGGGREGVGDNGLAGGRLDRRAGARGGGLLGGRLLRARPRRPRSMGLLRGRRARGGGLSAGLRGRRARGGGLLSRARAIGGGAGARSAGLLRARRRRPRSIGLLRGRRAGARSIGLLRRRSGALRGGLLLGGTGGSRLGTWTRSIVLLLAGYVTLLVRVVSHR